MRQVQATTPTPSTPRAPAIGVPQSRTELDALVMSRSELRDQLSAATQRRAELVVQNRMARGSDQELTARIAEIDARSSRIERQIQAADDAIAQAIANGIVTSNANEAVVTVPPPVPSDRIGLDRLIAFNWAGFALLGAAIWLMLRRRVRGTSAPALADQSRRLEQLQQAVDTMAVEVERISEGQRYVTKLLNERLQPAVGAGEAQPVPARRAESIPVRDSER